jgi:hypothetical protein
VKRLRAKADFDAKKIKSKAKKLKLKQQRDLAKQGAIDYIFT